MAIEWTTKTWLLLTLYWLWVVAGCLDFACHRRTDLAHTSGVAESAMHQVQLALCGSAAVLVLVFESTAGLAALLLAVVIVHAWAGYRDTRFAFDAGRTILPIEQHIHSVLDIAPWVAWAMVAWHAAQGLALDWSISPRRPAAGASLWIAVMAPALLLCVLPALREFRDAWRASGRGSRA